MKKGKPIPQGTVVWYKGLNREEFKQAIYINGKWEDVTSK